MDRLFRIDFYPQDWLVDTSRLPPDERGVFIQVVCLIYSRRGPIDYDTAWLAGLCGCSTRMVKSLVDKLVDKSFLQIVDGNKITQKRAEKELNSLRTRHENSAKGGRTSRELPANLSRKHHELKGEVNENNSLTSSDEKPPTRALESHPNRIPKDKIPIPVPTAARETGKPALPADDKGGGLKSFSGGGLGGRRFSIETLLSDDDRDRAKALCRSLNRDFYNLVKIYDEGVNSGKREAPRFPGGAFLKWINAYTKGERL